MTVAVKALRPRVKVIGVESVATGNFAAALRAGKPVCVPRRATLADGLATLTADRMYKFRRRPVVAGRAGHREFDDLAILMEVH